MKKLTIGLVGNPNSGKTTLFNALTGGKQRVGNWPGVTVERKSGYFTTAMAKVCVVDLPGLYSLTACPETTAIDEKIACDYILTGEADLIVNIIDASNLERNLYLTAQLLEMQAPLLVAVNMLDIAKKRGLQLDLQLLQKKLACPVVALANNKQQNLPALQAAIIQAASQSARPPLLSEVDVNIAQSKLTPIVAELAAHIGREQPQYANKANWLALRLLEDDAYAGSLVTPGFKAKVNAYKTKVSQSLGEDADIVIADQRYSFANRIAAKIIHKVRTSNHYASQICDQIILNRILGIPIFLLVMYSMFLFAINIGGAFQDFFDIGSETIFVQGLAHGLAVLGAPTWLIAIAASGLGKGINTTITFIPIIGAMFFFLSLLEDSGYMARAAFVMDRFMRAVGLPGKSFVPLIVGFGCNVPAIMSTRTLDHKRDRILTAMMSPFMACGARLAIFAVFTSAFFPRGGQNIVFCLYLIGILVAVFTGFILRKTLLQGDPAPLIMELPPYHRPNLHAVWQQTWQRLSAFIWRAGRYIVPICILIGALNAININGTLNTAEASTHSLLSAFGQMLTPLFAPLGITTNNWPATVGLLTGILAKEIVIATLNTLYTQVGHLVAHSGQFNFWAGIHAALLSVPHNLMALSSAFSNPVLASIPDSTVNRGVYGIMVQQFAGQASAFAYLLFILLYIPCISTTATMARELGKGWALFSLVWSTSLAYCIAVLFYQLATVMQHPFNSAAWLLGTVFYLGFMLWLLRYFGLPTSGAAIASAALPGEA